MRRTTRSCRLGGIISARMKRWRSSGSTVGCAIGLPAFADAPVLCRKRSTWSTRPSHCLLPTTSIKQRQNSPCHCLLNTLDAKAVQPLVWSSILEKIDDPGQSEFILSRDVPRSFIQKHPIAFGGEGTDLKNKIDIYCKKNIASLGVDIGFG